MVILPATKAWVIPHAIALEAHNEQMDLVMGLLEHAKEKHGGYIQARLDLPFRPRTTGEHSQNHRINGFIQQICMSTGNDFDAVKTWCKQQAISAGYPFTEFAGEAFPKSESKISVEEASILIETIERLASELGITLREI